LPILQLKHAKKWLLKELGKNGYKNSSVSDVRKGDQKYDVLLQTAAARTATTLLLSAQHSAYLR